MPTKKSAAAKTVSKKLPLKTQRIRTYGDKQDLLSIFNAIKPLIKKYVPPLTAKADYESRYEAWYVNDFEVMNRKFKEAYFAGLIIQSSYVGFYFMPVYMNPKMKDSLKPELLKLLKGKACFHIKKLDDDLILQLDDVLQRGFIGFKKFVGK